MNGENVSRPPWWKGALAGFAAALSALGVGELIGALMDVVGPVYAVGNRVVANTPPGAKELAIALFGQNDKPALIIGTTLIVLLAAVVIGILALRRWWIGVAGVALFGAIGMYAGVRNVNESWLAIVPTLVGTIVGIAVILWLLARAHGVTIGALRRARDTDTALADAAPDRRSFLLASGAVVLAAAGVGIAGRYLRGILFQATGRAGLTLPEPAKMLDPIPPGADLEVEGLKPFVSTNDIFYRIDTALVVPRVDVGDWTLRVTGMVDNELELSWQDLADMELIDIPITLTCVSNQIGGDLVDNARWRGVDLQALMQEAGISPDATQIAGISVDGYSCGFPTEVLGQQPALVAIGFNGEPLPLDRGFPARLVVSGLYGYVSATKWLSEIRATTFEDFTQFWVPRGYAERAPIKLMSAIDVPQPLAQIDPGTTVVAGNAWDQTVGIQAVEVKIDDGEWQEATLGAEVNVHTWRQWKYEWDATPGRHDVTVRAINKRGEVQTEARTDPKPDGATGWHSVVVLVRE